MQNTHSVGSLVESTMALISTARSGRPKLSGTTTGFFDLDQMIGGFQPGNLYVVAGRPGIGKTSFALGALLHSAVKKNEPTAIYSSTTDRHSLTRRMLSQMSGVPLQEIHQGTLDATQWIAVNHAASTLSSASINVAESTVFEAFRATQVAKDSFNERKGLSLLVVDGLRKSSLTLLSPELPPHEISNDSPVQRSYVQSLLRELKTIAVVLNCPVVLTWQLGPEIDQRANKLPTISDLHLTEIMEDTIDSVLLLYRDDLYRTDEEWDGLAEVRVVRNRNGVTGTVRLDFDAGCSCFRTLMPDQRH